MSNSPLFLPAKTDNLGSLTILEHGIHTLGIGRFLYDLLEPDFDKDAFLWACLMHDAGKVFAAPGSGKAHGPATAEGVDCIATSPEYSAILERLGIMDWSDDADLIDLMSHHHNLDAGATGMSIHISAADMIASGASSKSEDAPVNAALASYWNQLPLRKMRFPELTVFNSTKNEFLSIGKAMMVALLIEGLQSAVEITVLYATPNGCRVATRLENDVLRDTVSDCFRSAYHQFLAGQNATDYLIGSAGGFGQYQTLPKTMRESIYDQIIKKYADDIVKDAFDLRKELKNRTLDCESTDHYLSEIGLSLDLLKKFTLLEEMTSLVTNLSGTKTNLLTDCDGNIDPEIARRNSVKPGKKVLYADGAEPRYLQLLEKAGGIKTNVTKRDVIESKVTGLMMGSMQIRKNEPAPEFDIADYLSIDGCVKIPAVNDCICANCGANAGVIDLSMIGFREQQHVRETLFRLSNSQARSTALKVCSLCNMQALMNMFLSGVRLDRQYARINPKTHLLLVGIHISTLIESLLTVEDEALHRQLNLGFRVMAQNILVNGPNGLELVALSFTEFDNGITNRTYRQLMFSEISQTIMENIPGILGIGVNKVPEKFTCSILQTEDGDLPVIDDHRVVFFRWVVSKLRIAAKPRDKRDYVIRYAHQPVIGLNQLIRRENRKWHEAVNDIQEELRQMISEMSNSEQNTFQMAESIWDMARMAGGLSTSKNVGAFIKCFKGRPEDLDRLVNGLLKHDKITMENRENIIEIHAELRGAMARLSDGERRAFAEYLQKTKYLFNTLMFVKIRKLKEVSNESE